MTTGGSSREAAKLIGDDLNISCGEAYPTLYSVWVAMGHLLYAAVKGISDWVLWLENQHFSTAFAPYNVPSEVVLSMNEKAAGLETCTTG